MNRKIYAVFISAFILIGLMSNRNGRAAVGGVGSTGAPGDDATVCQSCHNGPIQVAMKISVLDGTDTVKAYQPGKQYTVKVNISHTGGNVPASYGFQIVSLNAPKTVNGPDNKSWQAVSSNTKVSTANGRMYVEHKDRSAMPEFEMKWTAPAAGTGPITFYSAGNGVNNNTNTGGDGSSRTNLELPEKSNVSTKEAAADLISIYPNPATHYFEIVGSTSSLDQLIIRDLLGREHVRLNKESIGKRIDLSNLPDGIFLVSMVQINGKIKQTTRLIKRSERP